MAYANWGRLMLKMYEPCFEVVVCGNDSELLLQEIERDFRPNCLGLFSTKESRIPLFRNRFKAGENLIYICREGVCQLPVKSVDEAKKLLEAGL
jgi:uncharacterized protein YyaL (SSP411 family)